MRRLVTCNAFNGLYLLFVHLHDVDAEAGPCVGTIAVWSASR